MKHNLKYINWKRECVITHVTIAEFVEIVEQLKRQGYKKIESSCSTSSYAPGTYSIKDQGKYRHIAVCDFDYTKQFYSTNFKDDAKNYSIGAGTDAYNAVAEKFRIRIGKSLTKIFSSTEEQFKTCVPKQFYYINKLRTNKLILSASSIDFCSHYPSCTCGPLPDAHPQHRKIIDGTVKPTKDYPFAFYLNSGHCAEYGVFDTHDWKKSFLARELLGNKESFNGDPFLPEDEDVTVLMPAARFTLDEEMQFYYSKRKEDETAKLVMNAFIGMCHTEKYHSHKKAHIAAIVIARANDKMRLLAEEIGPENVLHICVDGCIYSGKNKYGIDEKALGNCYQEFHDCSFKMIGTNCYVASKNGKVVKFKHGSFDTRHDGKDIEHCEGFQDMEQWFKQNKMEEVIK